MGDIEHLQGNSITSNIFVSRYHWGSLSFSGAFKNEGAFIVNCLPSYLPLPVPYINQARHISHLSPSDPSLEAVDRIALKPPRKTRVVQIGRSDERVRGTVCTCVDRGNTSGLSIREESEASWE